MLGVAFLLVFVYVLCIHCDLCGLCMCCESITVCVTSEYKMPMTEHCQVEGVNQWQISNSMVLNFHGNLLVLCG